MKYTTPGNCPYCDGEMGYRSAWGMNPNSLADLKARHDNGHPENKSNVQKDQNNYCPNCKCKLSPVRH